MIGIEFLVPNDETQPELIPAHVTVIPREGEEVWLANQDDAGVPYVVKWVRHDFFVTARRRKEAGSQRITVRLRKP